MNHLWSGVKRVGVYKNKSCFENSKGNDRICQTVWHLDRNSVTLLESNYLTKVRSKIVGESIDLGIGKRTVHAVWHHLSESLGF